MPKLFLFLVAGSVLSLITLPATAQKKPRQIILILADDLGWKDVGFNGSRYYQTPMLDSLAARSLVFTRAYANASNCAPSRACLMSGSYAARHGVYTVSPPDRGDARTRKLIPAPNEEFLAPQFKTLGKVFQEAGFKTAVMGKWHIGDDPTQQGFDIHKGGGSAGHPKTYFSPYNLKYLTDGPKGEYLTDRVTEESIRFIQENRNEDFFLYIPHFAIHGPLQGKQDLVEKYEKLPARDGQGTNADYAAMVENLDQNVGKVLAAVKRLGLEDPLIIFSSDNGGIASQSRQWPLRGGKGSYYEGGIRVPLLVSHSSVQPGTSDVPTLLFDLFPTLCAWAKAPLPTTQPIDGVSFQDVWQGKSRPSLRERSLFFHFPFYLEAYRGTLDDSRDPLFRTRPGSVVIRDNWKLHHYFEDDAYELYDLENDPGERIDLSTLQPGKLNEMTALLNRWLTSVDAPVPTELNAKYEAGFVPMARRKR